MKIRGVQSLLFLLGLTASPSVIAEEQVCTADGNCGAEEEAKVAKGCADGHDQCEFWASVGECEK